MDGYLFPCLYDPKKRARLARQSHSLSQASSSVSGTAETSCSPALKSPTDLCWSNSGEATTAAFRSFLPAEDALGLDFRFGDLLDFLREGDGDNFDLTTSGETCQISYQGNSETRGTKTKGGGGGNKNQSSSIHQHETNSRTHALNLYVN